MDENVLIAQLRKDREAFRELNDRQRNSAQRDLSDINSVPSGYRYRSVRQSQAEA
ncbi:MAG: hypothetical protein K2W86_07935 [Sphingomonas sp.]|uniref:hypothetical protein n=1 Tax=Sphingomonas sp. TaxID=28214 RepID=UPI0035A86DC8|nr:hypothetical protein [Sphingomonas sp.]